MSEKLSEYCRRQASRPCPEDYGFNVEWNLAADDALALEAKLEATEQDGMRLDWLERECSLYVEMDDGREAFSMLEFRMNGPSTSLRAAIDWAAQEEKE